MANLNLWRVKSSAMGTDDLEQELLLKWHQVRNRYPSTSPAHLMGLFKSSAVRRMNDLAKMDSHKPDLVLTAGDISGAGSSDYRTAQQTVASQVTAYVDYSADQWPDLATVFGDARWDDGHLMKKRGDLRHVARVACQRSRRPELEDRVFTQLQQLIA
jgi:hypothetical protein